MLALVRRLSSPVNRGLRAWAFSAVAFAALPGTLLAAPPATEATSAAALYQGKLPCADCAGIVYELRLEGPPVQVRPAQFQGGHYQLRMNYLKGKRKGKAGRSSITESGNWAQNTDGQLLLMASTGQEQRFRVLDARRIELLDTNGNPIMSNLNYKLTRSDGAAATPPPSKAAGKAAPLRGTYWRLVELRGRQVLPPANGQQEAHLEFEAKESRLYGSGGCNRLMGGFELKGNTLRFPPIASTRMACPQNMQLENDFLQTLEGVRGWQIQGQQLALSDERGVVVARLLAVEQKEAGNRKAAGQTGR